MIALNIAIFDQGHPISFRTLGAGVKINRFPNTVRWNDDKVLIFFSRLCANSGKISNSVLMTFFQAAICRKDRLCANYHAMQKKFGKKIFNFIPKVFLLAFYKPVTIISDLPPS